MNASPRHSSGQLSEPAPTVDPQLLITYRYVRMSLVAVLTMLAAAVFFQWFFADNHLPSISDYYWTPVHAVFIGALLALGVGMVILKPDSELEDIFLNIAGVLAPVVAFVPTPAPGTCFDDQGTFVLPDQATIDGIKNNIPALLFAGATALVIMLFFTKLRKEKAKFPPLERGAKIARFFGFAAILVLFGAAWAWFNAGDKSFDCHAHDAAAYTLFAAIIGVAILNGVRKFRESPHGGLRSALLNRYAVITVLMLAVLVIGLIGMKKDWTYWVLFVEGGVLLLFLVFWFLQSLDLWDRVVRPQEGVRTLLPQPKAPVSPSGDDPDGG